MAGHVFISYSRLDQDYVDRLVAMLRERGANVWLDRETDYGRRWTTVVRDQVRSCASMVVVMTPRSEDSEWVELEILEAKEQKKPIFPLLLEGNDVWFALRNRQAEWVIGGMMPTDRFVSAILGQSPTGSEGPPPEDRGEGRPGDRDAATTSVVDSQGFGDHTDIVTAVAMAERGTRLLIQPGVYRGSVILDKDIELVGDGPRDDIVLECADATPLIWRADGGRVENITIRKVGSARYFGVEVQRGVATLISCDISVSGLSGVIVRSARADIEQCRIHDCTEAGVVVLDNGRGTFYHNYIVNNGMHGVEVKKGGGELVFRHNRLSDNSQVGVRIAEAGQGTFEDNDITNNRLHGVAVEQEGDPIFRHNRVRGNTNAGVRVVENGRGTFEDNEIKNNGIHGVAVYTAGDPIVRHNRLRDNAVCGIQVLDNGRGTFEDNDITNNGLHGVEVKRGGDPIVRHNRLRANAQCGIHVVEEGRGMFEDNDITYNGHGTTRFYGIEIKSGTPIVRANRLSNNGMVGIVVRGGTPSLNDNIGGKVLRR